MLIYGTAELRAWRREPAGYVGRAYGDTRGIFFDGDVYTILHENISHVEEYRDYFSVQALSWVFKLMKDEEIGKN